jgi:hypothetical protein
MRFGSIIRFIELLQSIAANSYDSLIELHIANITLTTTHVKSSLAIAWKRLPTVDVSLPLGSQTVYSLSY